MKIDYSKFNRPFLGERVSGDNAITYEDEVYHYFVLVDGLGHGKEANVMSSKIEKEIQFCWTNIPSKIIANLQKRLTKSIGAAIGVLIVNKNTMRMHYSGLGNIRCKLLNTETTHNFMSSDGILGMRYRSSVDHAAELQPEDIILMYSDGISDLGEFGSWNRISKLMSSTITRRIVNQHGSDWDDSSCITIKIC